MGLEVHISKKLQSFCLKVDFETSHGILGVLGASGCGKSMTLKCIAGIETPDEGRIVLDGKVLYDSSKKINLPPQKRQVGYLFQSHALFPNMTIAENIGIGAKKPNREHVVSHYIKTFSLEGLEKSYPYQLSGGQKQRVALARMLAANPEVLLLDEPFSALDMHLKWKLEQELLGILEHLNKPVLFVSHSKDEVYHLCQTVGVMQHGVMQTIQTKEALFSYPQTQAEAMLSGYENILEAKKCGKHTIYLPLWDKYLSFCKPIPDKLTSIAIRAEVLQVAPSPNHENALHCTVIRSMEDAIYTILILKPHSISSHLFDPIYLKLPKVVSSNYHAQESLSICFSEEHLAFLID